MPTAHHNVWHRAGHTARLHFPAFFAGNYSHVTEFWLMEYEQGWCVHPSGNPQNLPAIFHTLSSLFRWVETDAWGIESPDRTVWIPWVTTWSRACFGLWHEQEINLHCIESLRVCYKAINLSWLIKRSSKSRSVEPNWRLGKQYKMQNSLPLLDPI